MIKITFSNRIFAFALTCISLVTCASAQNTDRLFISYTNENGLSNNHINCVVQDRQGFIWIATNNGLNRFDGISFDKIQDLTDEKVSVHQINTLLCDREGRILIGTNTGLHYFSPNENSYKSIELLPNLVITDILQTRNGDLWLGTHGEGIIVLDNNFNEKQNIRAENNPNLNSNFITDCYQKRNREIWIATNEKGIVKFDAETQQLAKVQAPDEHKITKIFEDSKGCIWLTTSGGGVFVRKSGHSSFKNYSYTPGKQHKLADNRVFDCMEAKNGNLWFATSGGLCRFDRNTERFVVFRPNKSQRFSINSYNIRNLLEDAQGNIWIGTYNHGVNLLEAYNNQFHLFRNHADDENSIRESTVVAVTEDSDGNIWLGMDGDGLSCFNRMEQRFHHFKIGTQHGLPDKTVFKIFEDNESKIWIGTYRGGLSLLADKKKGEFKTYRHDPSDKTSLSSNDVRDIFQDSRGNLWVATNGGGINLFDPETKTFSALKRDQSHPKASLCSDYCLKIHEDQLGFLWFATYGGLSMYNPSNQKFVNFWSNVADSASISHNWVYSVWESAAGELFFGTANGLNRFNREKMNFTQFTTPNGLPDNAIKAIEGRGDTLWISTDMGLASIRIGELDQLHVKHYTRKDGLQGNEFYRSSSCRLKNGQLAFGGTHGLSYFHPDSIQGNSYVPPVVISAIKLGNYALKPHYSRTTSDKVKTIELPFQEKVITFNFSALNFISPEQNQYAYRLNGFENKWNYSTTKRSVTYTNLAPGEYLFHVKASNNDKIWNDEGAKIRLIITPPFYQTYWAYAIYIFLVASVLFLLQRFTIIRIKEKNKLEIQALEYHKNEELTQAKLRFFTNVSHEFRTTLTLIVGPVEQLLQQKNTSANENRQYLSIIQRNAKRLHRLIDQLLDFRKMESDSLALNVQRLDIVDFLANGKKAFDQYAKQKNIQFLFETETESLIMLFDPDKLEKIMYNLFSNAFKFTDKEGTVKIRLSEQNNEKERFLQIEVSDSGCGIAESEQKKIFTRFYQGKHNKTLNTGTGIGLSMVKKIVDLHHGQIEVESEENKGATFRLKLPLDESFLSPFLIHGEGRRHAFGNEVELPTVSYANTSSQRKSDRILIVEDNADVRIYLEQILNPFYITSLCENGLEALEILKSQTYDLVISDVLMPEMDGLELCRNIKNNTQTRFLPVVLLTAQSTSEQQLKGMQQGADLYISKPFNSEFVLQQIENLLATRKNFRNHFAQEILLKPTDIEVGTAEERFLKRAVQVVEKHIGSVEFSAKIFEQEMGMSHSIMSKKMKEYSGKTATEFIRDIRMKRAVQLLQESDLAISEIAYQIGFNDPKYFSKVFKQEFGKRPSEWRNI